VGADDIEGHRFVVAMVTTLFGIVGTFEGAAELFLVDDLHAWMRRSEWLNNWRKDQENGFKPKMTADAALESEVALIGFRSWELREEKIEQTERQHG
jgi:hypothetical protein